MQTLRQGTLLQGCKYIIERELGQGTFGITYLARTTVTVGGTLGNMQTTVNVAIKEFFMHELNTRKEGSAEVEGNNSEVALNYRRRFRKEAVNLSHMNHSGIVKVLDVFDENETTYYVMEFIEGGSLDRHIVERNGLAAREAIGMVLEIGSALSYMHSKRMLHLDLKPSNIMLRGKGNPVLIDFGLSKQFNEKGEAETSTTIGRGTKGYAPIEQMYYREGRDFPVTMDVYALGATMLKMLTRKTPPDSSVILNDGFPFQELETIGMHKRLLECMAKAMAPRKQDRYQSVEEFTKALTELDMLTKEDPVEITAMDDFQPMPLKPLAKASNGELTTFVTF